MSGVQLRLFMATSHAEYAMSLSTSEREEKMACDRPECSAGMPPNSVHLALSNPGLYL